ncbi:hypothetical protein [Luteipulveratus mongoliensis]|uniref:Uncharacterized protein n=1 Tax=Luteipulveratus mongoliensis TaxID=571913 RepID=A0A0K1JHI4_9MICO|nr:hypothetical protein [Luteipulveratus mongoliensis]AKU16161.1 hypothetical protein VV02_10290 [Luteipulveratus mongoliensis]
MSALPGFFIGLSIIVALGLIASTATITAWLYDRRAARRPAASGPDERVSLADYRRALTRPQTT